MNEQQQRMAAVGTDKELSDLLDFSAVREWEEQSGWFGVVGGWHWEKELKRVRYRSGGMSRGELEVWMREVGGKGGRARREISGKIHFLNSATENFFFFGNNRFCQPKIFPSFILGMQR